MSDPQEPVFHRVARSGQVPDGIVRRMFIGELAIAVSRLDGTAHATSNYCSHLDCLLSSGAVTDDGLLCSCHGSVFDFADGEPVCPPPPNRSLSSPCRSAMGTSGSG